MKFPIALQLYSVRDELEKDFAGTLTAVKAMGYDGVEFAGLYGHGADEVRDLCRQAGLTPISAHVPFVDMMADPEGMMADYAKIGCRYVAIPYLTEEYRPGAPKFAEVLEGAKVLGEAACRHGMQLLYHNHDFEFEKVDGECALDLLYRVVPPELLQTELDTCWVNVGGEEPAAYIRRYHGRTPVVHLKDFWMAGKKPAKMYELIGIEEDEGASEAEGAFELRPLGAGVQDFPAIIRAAEESGASWLVVEQDSPSMGKTPMECAAASRDYLKTLGL